MASHFDDFVRQGLVAVKSKRFGTWKKRWLLLRRYSSAGPPRLEEFTEAQALHRLTDSSSAVPIRVVPLINVAGVTQGNSRPNPRKRKVTICFFNNSVDQYKFRPNSAQEAEQWRRDIDEVSSMIYADMRRISDDPVPGFSLVNHTECFGVFLQPSPILSFSGECSMEVTSSHVNIRDPLHDHLLVTWDIDTIRKFGSDGQQLHIETGRSSSTGEGFFEFRSFEAQKIERQLNSVTFALSTAEHVMRQGGAPVLPRRSSHQLQMQRPLQHRQQQQQQPMAADARYLHHAQSEPGHTAGLFAMLDSPPTYRRPSVPSPYPLTTSNQSPTAVTSRTDISPIYFPPAASAVGGRRPSTPVFFSNQSSPLSAFPFDFNQEAHELTSYLECPPVLPERSYHRHLASSNDLCRLQQQQQQRGRQPEVTSSPPRPPRSASIATSSNCFQSSPSPIHASRGRHPAHPPPPPPSHPPSASFDPPPPPVPPRVVFLSSTESNDV